MTIADLRRETATAAAEAVAGAVEVEGTAPAEATTVEGTESGASPDGQSATVVEAPVAPEALPEGTDVPTEYFGYKFPPDLTPEQRAEFIGELKKREDTIGKLLRGKETPAAPAAEEEPVAPVLATDEEILQALGLDPNDPFSEQTAKAVLPVVRKQMEQENVIAQLIEIQELNEIDRTWRSTLSTLEKEFGALPAEVTHDSVMEFAAENKVSSPVDAYWRIVGPGRSAVEAMAGERAAKLLAAKASAATTRPGGGNATTETPLESKTTKGATREALGRILRETYGMDDAA